MKFLHLNHLRRRAPLGMLLALCLPATAADITWFAFSDCHYGGGEPPRTTTPKVDWINNLPGTPLPEPIGGEVAKPLGVIMSGDLIDNGHDADKYPQEWENYKAEFGVNGEGKCKFPVFEGMGNHDWNKNLFMYNNIKERNLKRKELGLIKNISENGYHYSWDWEGVHFINLNIFPGNQWAGESDPYPRGAHDPLGARAFLEKDLRENVGNSGRPVITIHHFRPIDENWWTYTAADRYHKIIQDYNVAVIMVGHQGGGVNNVWRGINWASSNGELEVFRVKPDNTLSIVARNANGWGKPFQKKIFFSWETSDLAAWVTNGEWATNVTHESATLSGKIIYEASAGSEVTIHWGTKDGGNKAEAWEHVEKLGPKKAGELFTTNIKGLQPWTQYYYRVRVTNSKGEAWAAASIPFFSRGSLPANWDTAFLGFEQRPWGGAHLADGTLTVRGSGADFAQDVTNIDNFQYTYTQRKGDGEIQAQLLTLDNKSRRPLSGVLMREDLKAGSRSFGLMYSEKEGIRTFARAQTDGPTALSKPVRIQAPVYLKIVRNGTNFTGFASKDGKDWTQVGEPVPLEMKPDITAGVGISAGNSDSSKNIDGTFSDLQTK